VNQTNAMPGASGLRWLWLSVTIVVLDQWTKTLIVAHFALYERLEMWPVLSITRLHNTGAAFSFLSDAGGWQRWFFVVLGLAVSGLVTVWLRRLPARGRSWLAAALAMIVGGAVGNIIDRLLHGYVVDFISVHYDRWFFPAFNVADSAITIGAVMLLIESFMSDDDTLRSRREKKVES
jgi:signal peptidase II